MRSTTCTSSRSRPTCRSPAATKTTTSSRRRSQVHGRRRGHQGAPRKGAARPGRHDRRRDLGIPRGAPQAPGVPHNVLNAKEHERESEIIKDAEQRAGHDRDEHGRSWRRHQAGRRCRRARRPLRARHRATRVTPIDNQLRGRSGRQGDPGETRSTSPARTISSASSPATGSRTSWSASSSRTTSLWRRRSSRTRSENAQKKVEEQNFVARKNVLKYDDVMNAQRQVIYEQRRRVASTVTTSPMTCASGSARPSRPAS